MVSKREKMRTSTNIRRCSGNCRLSSMLILYVLVLCSFYAYCEARDTMRPGEWIIDNGETQVSAGGKFEFGFFSPPGSSGNKRYVGIWYNEWDDNRTVVWVANRNFPIINAIGVFNVTEELGLKVLDTSGKEYWSADVSWLSCPCINLTFTLTDLGNLIFREIGQQTNLWDSCGTPTDTLLPGTDVNNGVTLISWRGSDDPGEGSLTFDIGPDGIKDRYTNHKGGNKYCKHFSSDEIEAKLKNLSEDFTARFVMDFSGKIEYWRWGVKV